jgi:hypothetical protein
LKRKHHSQALRRSEKMHPARLSRPLSRHVEYANKQITYHFWLCQEKEQRLFGSESG